VAIWGGTALLALLLLGNKIPIVKNDVLKKIPLVRGYFIEQDNIPDSDKPFWDGLLDGWMDVEKCTAIRHMHTTYVTLEYRTAQT
jgi:hypothetical protein